MAEEEEDNSIDRLIRVFFYKGDQECFTLEKGSLKITQCDIPGLALDNPILVRYGYLGRKSDMYDLRFLDMDDVQAKMKSFERGKFLCMEILSNPSSLYFDLPDMNVSLRITFRRRKFRID